MDRHELPLLAPGLVEKSIREQQRITATFGEQSRSFNALLDISPTQLQLTALGNLGRPILSANWDGERLQGSRIERLPPEITPQRILNDIQAAYWPCSSWVAAGFTVNCGATRQIVQSGKKLYSVSKTKDHLLLHNLRYGYTLVIRSLPVARAGIE